MNQAAFAELKSAPYSWEIRTAPIAFLAKWITLDLSYFYNQFAFGPSVINYASTDTNGGMLSPTYNGLAYGAHFIFAGSFHKDSFYVGGHAYTENFKSYPHAFLGYEDRNGTKANIDVGHRWVSKDFSSMLGFGLESHNHSVETVNTFTSTTTLTEESLTLFHIEFKIGYLFF